MVSRSTEPLSLRANALWNTFGCAFYLGCQWLTTVLVVTLSDGYGNSGILAFAMAAGLVFASIGLYGLRPYQVSDIEERTSNSEYIAFRLVTNGIGFAVCAIYLLAITWRPELLIACFLYLIFKFDETFSDVIYGIYQKNGRMDLIGRSQIARGIISVALFATPLLLLGNVNMAIVCMAAGCIAVTFIYDLPHASLFGSIWPKLSRSVTAFLLKTCFPGMAATVLLSYAVTSVRQYYGIIDGDSALGIYAAIATPTVLVQFAANYLSMPFIGEIAKGSRAERSEYLRALAKMLGVVLGGVVAACAMLLLAGPWLLELLYGPSITEHLDILPYVLLATALMGLLSCLYNALAATSGFGWAVLMAGCAFALSIGSALFLIAQFHMNGVNLAIIAGGSAGLIIGLLGTMMQVRKIRSAN